MSCPRERCTQVFPAADEQQEYVASSSETTPTNTPLVASPGQMPDYTRSLPIKNTLLAGGGVE
ncbi:MAG: hypothetical protein ACJ8BW_11090 [Ktedonobacteraceae bacterium]